MVNPSDRFSNVESGKITKQLPCHKVNGDSVAFCPNGKFFASGTSEFTIIIWDVKTMEKLKFLDRHKNFVQATCFFSDGKELASGDKDNLLFHWNTKSWSLKKELRGH